MGQEKLSRDHYYACLLGGAIGDAMGAPVEFMSFKSIREAYGPEGVTNYVEYSDGKGEFTDDTQMTLFTAEALLRAWNRAIEKGIGGALPTIGRESYQRWLITQAHSPREIGSLPYANGWLIQQTELFKRRSPGNTCLSSLMKDVRGTIDNPINNSKGCGGIMRMAPVGLVFYGRNETAFENGCQLAAITHGHPSGYLSAGFLASIIADLAVGIELKKTIKNGLEIIKNWQGHEETMRAVEHAIYLYNETTAILKAHPEKVPEVLEQLGGGWVGEEALAISLFCSLLYEKDFKKGVLAAVNHSGDSDSTGSITGNILGLINGLNSIPSEWIENLKYHELVQEVAEDLHTGFNGCFDRRMSEKYPGF